MSPNPRTVAGGLAAAVLGSGVTAALLLGPDPTSAAPPTTEPSATEPSDSGTTDDAATESETDVGGEELREALQPLVDSGALTADQADDIVSALIDTVGPSGGPVIRVTPGFPNIDIGRGFPELPGGREHGPIGGRFRIIEGDVVAEAIGIDEAELREQLRDGLTVAEIAEANGVDPQVVIDALVADYTERVTAWIEGEQPATDEAPATEDTDTTETTSA